MRYNPNEVHYKMILCKSCPIRDAVLAEEPTHSDDWNNSECTSSNLASVSMTHRMKTAILVAQRYGYRVVATSLKFDGTKEMNYLNLV